jgi:peptidoglycan/xylan/chitin deacetylase (PgdA/CDA1 family)
MRIVQLLSQMQPTGAEAYAITVANWLTDQGHQVWFISDKLHSAIRQPFIPMSVHKNSFTTRWTSTRTLRRFLIENKIQVVHAHSRAAARLAFWATLGLKIATVSTIHGRQPVSFSKKIFDIYGEKVICICENVMTTLTEKLSMNRRKMRVIRNPVNSAALPFQEDLSPEMRIAWIGRFTGPKGQRAQEFLQQVAPGLLKAFPQLHIDVIGGDPALLGAITSHPQVHVQNHHPRLDDELGKYQVVLAAGRIAISSLLRGIPTYAIGEYSAPGLVRGENLDEVLKSNFGDIGADGAPMGKVDFAELEKAILNFLRDPGVLAVSERRGLRDEIFRSFDQGLVCKKIFNTYKSAFFEKNYPHSIPVMMYHKTPDQDLNSPHRIFVTKDNFETHLQYYQARSFTTLHFRDLEKFRSGEQDFAQFPRRPLMLTFDDGYVDNLTNAAPLLKRYGFKAIIYLLADHTLTSNSWDHDGKEPLQPLMSLEQKRKLLEFDYEIGSHGHHHQRITEMTDIQARDELALSKSRLESDFGVPVTTFAYTYGVTSPRAAELAEEAGYDFAVNTDSGGLRIDEDPFAIFRINIFPEDGPVQLWKKTATWYRRYFYWKRGH